MATDELLERIGRVALDLEEGRRPSHTADQIHIALDELHHALTLSPRDDRRQAILARVSSLLESLD